MLQTFKLLNTPWSVTFQRLMKTSFIEHESTIINEVNAARALLEGAL